MQPQEVSTNEAHVALPLRPHTIFGTCEAIGEDFGFNPTLLRVPLAALVLWSPLAAVGVYFGLSLIVLASRLIFPQPKALSASADGDVRADNDEASREQMAIAA